MIPHEEQLVIGIAMSTYNGSRYLETQIRSIQAQSEDRWCLLVRDDGSTDGTRDRLREMARLDQRIVVIDDGAGNIGVTQSFSRIIAFSKRMNPDYLMFCDQDDIWEPDKVAQTLRHMCQQESLRPGAAILVHTDLTVVDEQGDLIHPSMWAFARMDPALNTLPRLLVQNTVTGCTVMINRILLKLLGPIPHQALLHDWWIALVASALGHLSPLTQSTISYRQHGSNVAGIRRARSLAHWLRSLLRILPSGSAQDLREQLVLRPAAQAGALVSTYSAQLAPEQRELLQSFAGISTLPWHSRRILLITRGVRRQRLQHNLSLMLLA